MNNEAKAEQMETEETQAVDAHIESEVIEGDGITDQGETAEENPLAMVDESVPEAAEEAAMHEENPLEEATEEAILEAADIAEAVAVPDQPNNAATAPRNAGKKRWYIIHAYSGFEKKVAASILEQAVQQGLSDKFEEVTVPAEEVVEMRRGKKVAAERKFFPGYVLAKMEMTDAAWQLVKSTDKVSGFLGGGGARPQPISEAEAQAIFQQVQEGVDSPKRAVMYEIGEQVKVTDGPFESFIGVVEEIDEEKEKLKVSVSIFGRATPVELEFGQVDKV